MNKRFICLVLIQVFAYNACARRTQDGALTDNPVLNTTSHIDKTAATNPESNDKQSQTQPFLGVQTFYIIDSHETNPNLKLADDEGSNTILGILGAAAALGLGYGFYKFGKVTPRNPSPPRKLNRLNNLEEQKPVDTYWLQDSHGGLTEIPKPGETPTTQAPLPEEVTTLHTQTLEEVRIPPGQSVVGVAIPEEMLPASSGKPGELPPPTKVQTPEGELVVSPVARAPSRAILATVRRSVDSPPPLVTNEMLVKLDQASAEIQNYIEGIRNTNWELYKEIRQWPIRRLEDLPATEREKLTNFDKQILEGLQIESALWLSRQRRMEIRENITKTQKKEIEIREQLNENDRDTETLFKKTFPEKALPESIENRLQQIDEQSMTYLQQQDQAVIQNIQAFDSMNNKHNNRGTTISHVDRFYEDLQSLDSKVQKIHDDVKSGIRTALSSQNSIKLIRNKRQQIAKEKNDLAAQATKDSNLLSEQINKIDEIYQKIFQRSFKDELNSVAPVTIHP